jgi:hypothetical protein
MSHRHTPLCWSEYEPCGEHHSHDYNCGGGTLSPRCPDYVKPIGELIFRKDRYDANAKTALYVCLTCNTAYPEAKTARNCYRCITSRACESCGQQTGSRALRCSECRDRESALKKRRQEAKAFNAAKKVSAKEYAQGPCDHICLDFWPDEGDYTILGEEDEDDRPWVWGCKPMPWPVPEMEDVVGTLLEDEFPEGAHSDLTNLDMLQDLVNAWFREKGPSGYFMIDKTTVVVLDPELTPERMEVPE